MSIGLHLCHQFECRVCKQAIEDERVQESQLLNTLFGSINYAVCPSCGQIVEENDDRGYIRRAERFITKRNYEERRK